MLAVAAARSLILQHCQPIPAESTPLLPSSLGRVLAEAAISDVDSPPFDKALMDGFAVRSLDLTGSAVKLRVVEEILAGHAPTRSIGTGQCSRIMTGDPLPEGADAVVMIEQTRSSSPDEVEISVAVRGGQNILPCGAEIRKGAVVLAPGTVLRPQEFGILATAGKAAVAQIPGPQVAILSTGDELVEPPTLPGPGQIRNSNAPMLLAQATRAGGNARYLGIGRDQRESLQPLVEQGLQSADVLLLSGGVSVGKADLVPEVLREAGVTGHFHKIAMKPGKPLFFGTVERQGRKKLVFGLPGNPVSSLVCFELFVRPALRALAGYSELDLPAVQAKLTENFTYRSDRPTYYPACLTSGEEGWAVLPVLWLGAADLLAFSEANALLALPAGELSYAVGQRVTVLRLEG